MEFRINKESIWYHGSNKVFELLEKGSTVTQWKELAQAFSHKPQILSYDDDGVISHNGNEHGYLYIIDEPVKVDIDLYQHPRTTMDKNIEFTTTRSLKVKLIEDLNTPAKDVLKKMEEELYILLRKN